MAITTVSRLQVRAGTLTDAEVATANKDGGTGVYSMRTLGTGSTQAAAGNHTHGTGAANRLAYWTSATALAYDDGFRVDAANDWMGIGADPTGPLEISNTRTLAVATPNIATIRGSATFEQSADLASDSYSAYNMTVLGTTGHYNTGSLIGSRLFVTARSTGSPAPTLASLFGYACTILSDTTCTATITNFIGFNPTITHKGTGTVTTLGGLLSNPTLQGGGATDGNATTVYAYRSAISNTSAAGTITTGYGLLVSAPTGTGTITTCYGVNVSNQGRAGITTAYAYYAASQSGAGTSWAFYGAGGQSYLAAGTATDVPLTIHGTSSQSGNLQEWENTSSVTLAAVSAAGAGTFNVRDTGTNTVVAGLKVGHQTSGTPAANFGVALDFIPQTGAVLTNVAARIHAIMMSNATSSGYGADLVFSTATGGATQAERFRITEKGNIYVGTGSLATTVTDGFLYLPSCAGAPTGVPTAVSGLVPLIYDRTNNKLYAYNTAWKAVTLA